MRRRLALVSLALLLLALVSALAVHTPPVRALALRFAIRAALDRGIQTPKVGRHSDRYV